jgi:uncharacterized protein YabE (DUF348 family)/3D (Asp-Asp-Asp) domain-containing protein
MPASNRPAEKRSYFMITIKMLSKRLSILVKPLIALAAMTAIVFSATAGLTASVRKVTVIDGGSTTSFYTTSDDPYAILDRAGVVMADADEYDMTVSDDGEKIVTVKRAFAVNVTANGKQQRVLVTGGTVADILAKCGVEYDSDDYINYALTDPAEKNMTIEVSDVNVSTFSEQVEYNSDTDIVYSDSLYEGQTKVTDGEAGLMMVTYAQRIVDGEAVETYVVDETVIKEAVAPKKIIGTKKVATVTAASQSAPAKSDTAQSAASGGAFTYLNSGLSYVSALRPSNDFELDANGIPLNYSKVLTGKASAYCASQGAHTSTGKLAQTGYIAVDPKIIPYGTKLFIRSTDGRYIYGYASAEDTGGFTKWGTRIADLYFNSYSECVRFGVRSVEIYVLS